MPGVNENRPLLLGNWPSVINLRGKSSITQTRIPNFGLGRDGEM